MLVRCLYASRAQIPQGQATDAVLDDIIRQSRRNNGRRGVTGMLCCANDVFVQVIEGGRAEVSELMGRIFADRRHSGLQILMYEEILQRRFSNWSMGQVNIGGVNPGLLLKHSPKAELDPFGSPGATTMALLIEIAEMGAVGHRVATGSASGDAGGG